MKSIVLMRFYILSNKLVYIQLIPMDYMTLGSSLKINSYRFGYFSLCETRYQNQLHHI